jgi:dynein heavy chain 2, cytosolic
LKNPDEEKKRIELLKNEGKLTQEKSNLQEKLLEELTHAEGDILKNEKLLSTLNDIKEKTIKIESSLIESNEIRSKLLDNNSQSKSVCTQSAEFYIKISKIYRIDYKSFIDIFLNVFGKQSDVDEFLHLYKDLVKKTFYLISRSIKESEHTQLSLNVIHCAFPKLIPNVEWELFIFNFTESETSAIVNMPSWIKKELVPKLTSLNSQCPNFFKNLNLDNDHEWIEFINATENIPKTFPNTPKITEFQKLLVYQIFRPDFLLPIIQQISSKMLGMKEDSFQQPRIRQLLAETEERNEPILIIAGSTDPTSELIEFSKTLNVVYREVFIGEEKDVDVLNLLTNFANNGGVLCFKNVHLRVKIIEKNESIIKSIKLHKNFRIVYTCENDKNLSTSILMKCKTFVMEPPSGIKFKILSLFEQNQKIFKDKLNGRQMKICVAIFILHSILLECQNYIPQGWCKWYDFCDADIKASLDFFWSIKSNANNIDWTLLRGFLEKIVYGGRVDNGQDMKVLN